MERTRIVSPAHTISTHSVDIHRHSHIPIRKACSRFGEDRVAELFIESGGGAETSKGLLPSCSFRCAQDDDCACPQIIRRSFPTKCLP